MPLSDALNLRLPRQPAERGHDALRQHFAAERGSPAVPEPHTPKTSSVSRHGRGLLRGEAPAPSPATPAHDTTDGSAAKDSALVRRWPHLPCSL